jgi:hypothetical protein
MRLYAGTARAFYGAGGDSLSRTATVGERVEVSAAKCRDGAD